MNCGSVTSSGMWGSVPNGITNSVGFELIVLDVVSETKDAFSGCNELVGDEETRKLES